MTLDIASAQRSEPVGVAAVVTIATFHNAATAIVFYILLPYSPSVSNSDNNKYY